MLLTLTHAFCCIRLRLLYQLSDKNTKPLSHVIYWFLINMCGFKLIQILSTNCKCSRYLSADILTRMYAFVDAGQIPAEWKQETSILFNESDSTYWFLNVGHCAISLTLLRQ